MADNLHILNGDSSWHLFQETGIPGETLVWREILCEGPVQHEIATPEFWSKRDDFVKSEFGAGPADYKQLIDDFEKLKDFKSYTEIILWFEYDLFCQVNMMALLSWCYRQNVHDHCKVSMICVGDEPGYERLIGLGRIPPHRYTELYEERTILTGPSLAYADRVWKAYTSEDPNELEFALMPHPVFSYLSGAMKSHLKRFPYTSCALNEIEQEILITIQNEEVHNVDDVVRHMLQWQHYYGFGDLQYFRHIRLIRDLIIFEDPMTLSSIGKEAISGNWSRNSVSGLNYQLGGSEASSFNWNEDSGELIPS